MNAKTAADTTKMLSEVRRQILKWESAPPGSREENEAAEAATRAMAELDAALCDGADLPVPWQTAQYPKEETRRPPDSPTRGESSTRGESFSRERMALARRLEAAGHGGCAFDLEAADDRDVVTVAYAIVQHLEGDHDPRREDDELLAQDIKDWADRHDRDL